MDITKNESGYEMVTHPKHYNRYRLEVIDILERIYGTTATILWCEMTAMKYRLRMGEKPGEDIHRELEKEEWYLAKRDELITKTEGSDANSEQTVNEEQTAQFVGSAAPSIEERLNGD